VLSRVRPERGERRHLLHKQLYDERGAASRAQIAAGGRLIAYLMDQLNLDFDAIKGHTSWRASTALAMVDRIAWKHILTARSADDGFAVMPIRKPPEY
jgi:hypothetical protein